MSKYKHVIRFDIRLNANTSVMLQIDPVLISTRGLLLMAQLKVDEMVVLGWCKAFIVQPEHITFTWQGYID